ncbi:17427_t:CDS:1, partial [Gigaspora rosea]
MFFISIFVTIRVKTSKIRQFDSCLESIYRILNKHIYLELISLERESSASTNEEKSKDIKNIEVEE